MLGARKTHRVKAAVARRRSLLPERPVLQHGREERDPGGHDQGDAGGGEGPDGLETGDGLGVALHLLLEREQAADLLNGGQSRGSAVSLTAEGLLRGQSGLARTLDPAARSSTISVASGWGPRPEEPNRPPVERLMQAALPTEDDS